MSVEVAEVSITALVEQLQQKHCLLVLDNVESICRAAAAAVNTRRAMKIMVSSLSASATSPTRAALS